MVDEEVNFLKSNAKDKKEKEIKDLANRRVKLGCYNKFNIRKK